MLLYPCVFLVHPMPEDRAARVYRVTVKVRRKIITCHRFSVYYLHLYLLKLKVQLDERLIKGG